MSHRLGEIIAIYVSDKRLYPYHIENSNEQTIKRHTNNSKMSKSLEQTLYCRRYKMANKIKHKTYDVINHQGNASLKAQQFTILAPELLKLKRLTTPNVGENIKQLELLCILGCLECKLTTVFGKLFDSLLQT